MDEASAPTPRCCARHDDWPTLARHVMRSFPTAEASDVFRELRLAKDVIDMFDVGDDALQVAELIARHRLRIATGEQVDAAKLDPQPHPGRRSAAVRTA